MTKANWISVKDRLPEEYVGFLVNSRPLDTSYRIIAFLSGNKWISEETGRRLSKVTHWNTQPLPEPPVAEEEG